MRILAIGDVHGRKKWEAMQSEEVDKVIFVGDYFDHFNITQEDQIKNFENILEWKRREPEKVTLLFGNHDYHYLLFGKVQFSGYRANALISQIIDESVKNKELQLVYTYDNYLFSHAGVSQVWMDFFIKEGYQFDDLNDILIQKPKVLNFGHYGWPISEYGDDPDQGPLWIRPYSLGTSPLNGWKQVVGHTVHKNINISGDLIFIDSPDTNEVLEINDGLANIYLLK